MVIKLSLRADPEGRAEGSGVARTPKKFRTPKGDYRTKQLFSSIASLFKMETSLKGNNLFQEGANCFLKEFY